MTVHAYTIHVDSSHLPSQLVDDLLIEAVGGLAENIDAEHPRTWALDLYTNNINGEAESLVSYQKEWL